MRGNTQINKTNILMIGPTGSGKTYIMQTLANILKLPFVIVDATSFTEAGYVGDDVNVNRDVVNIISKNIGDK